MRAFAASTPRERARRLALAIALVLAACASALPPAQAALEAWAGGATPPLAQLDLAGRPVSLDAFRGRVLIVNFWATWCAPCVEEIPDLQRLRERLAAHGLEIVAINHQESASRVARFVDRLRIDFPVVRDHDGRVSTAWSVRVFPTTYVLAPDLSIAYVAVGAIDWSSADVESRIRSLLARRPASAGSTAARANAPDF